MLEEMKELIEDIKMKQAQVDWIRDELLANFQEMSQEDMALSDGEISDIGIDVKYYPESTSRKVDTAKLKEDGIYENYSKEVKRKDYIRVNIHD